MLVRIHKAKGLLQGHFKNYKQGFRKDFKVSGLGARLDFRV